MFQISLLERDVTRKEELDQKIAVQLEFEEGKKPDQEVSLIGNSRVFAEEAMDIQPTGLYYLIHGKKETHSEDTLETVEEIAHLQKLLKKYHAENPEKHSASSPPVDTGAAPPLIAAWSEAKVTPPIPAFIRSTARKRPLAHKSPPLRVFSTTAPNWHPSVRVRHSGQWWKSTSTSQHFLENLCKENTHPVKLVVFILFFPLWGFQVLTRLR